MAEKKAAEKEKAPEKAATAPDKGKEPAKPDKAVKKEPDKTAEPPKRSKRACRPEENFHLEGTGGQSYRGQGKDPKGGCSEKGS